MPTLLPVEGRRVTRSLTVFQAISDMQIRLRRTMWKEASQSRNQMTVPSLAKIRKELLPDVLAIEYLNYAIEIVSRNAEITNYTATFTQADFSQDSYGGWSMAYPTAAHRIDYVLYSTGSDEGKALENGVISIDDLERRTPDWRNAGTSTPPLYGVLFGKDRFGLYPKPSDSTYNVYLIGVGKPSIVGYDTGNGTVSSQGVGLNTISSIAGGKTYTTNQWLNGIIETLDTQIQYLVTANSTNTIGFSGLPDPSIAAHDFRVDNIIPLPDEFHGLCIDTAMNIFLSGGSMAAEEVLLKSQTFKRLWRDLQQKSYIEPRVIQGDSRRVK